MPGHAWETVLCWRGFHFARRSVRRCLVFAPFAAKQTKRSPKHRICIAAWSCWGGLYTEQLLHRGVLHRGALNGGSFTQRSFYKGRTLHTESFTQRNFTQERFYAQKLLHREVFIQSSLDTQKFAHTHTQRLLHREAFYAEQLFPESACEGFFVKKQP